MKKLNKDEIFLEIQKALVELFELEATDIKPETHLYEELDLDSLDAVDLIVHLQKLTGEKIKPDEFKLVRTVNDIVLAVESVFNKK